ncbi:hypothetical protein [Escherichia coli]
MLSIYIICKLIVSNNT